MSDRYGRPAEMFNYVTGQYIDQRTGRDWDPRSRGVVGTYEGARSYYPEEIKRADEEIRREQAAETAERHFSNNGNFFSP